MPPTRRRRMASTASAMASSGACPPSTYTKSKASASPNGVVASSALSATTVVVCAASARCPFGERARLRKNLEAHGSPPHSVLVYGTGDQRSTLSRRSSECRSRCSLNHAAVTPSKLPSSSKRRGVRLLEGETSDRASREISHRSRLTTIIVKRSAEISKPRAAMAS
eukprot:1081165-Prymnesium_polylepis.1